MLLKLALVCLGNLVTSICCIDVTVNSILDAEIKVASSQLDKMNLPLNNNLTWFFDFTTQPHYTYTPGAVVNADAATFPASTNYGMTMALINLGPCGMLPPHYHPRGTNLWWQLRAKIINAKWNQGCTKATLVSALNSEDAGTQNILNGFAQLPKNVMTAAFGNPIGGFNLPPIPERAWQLAEGKCDTESSALSTWRSMIGCTTQYGVAVVW
ncbi:predicted protein [Sclerotinia sclerotiorum 1980 UF-70]|uniref:Cupin type-1 domain-containing protein n=1 Tax=Sclerotinia sclerotiorum (strain ATCC 18683 / 1980 / Ss-1) TaxID=665079 RepID=A7EHH4_SCLS1|nr:predicted protein [Sclerotinia sclerotiorum 1980 UF-70]EDO02290.1 predicted protein [Sclerotinia sclerotiorum 1980 UF-70]